MRESIASAFSLALLLTACGPASSGSTESSIPQAAQPQLASTAKENRMEANTDESPTVALDRVARKGMAYADFRNEVLALGWQPVVDPQCKVNVAGSDHVALCEGNPDLPSCRACDEIPELSAYSGDARSLSVFRNEAGGLRLEVTGVGELSDWNVAGEESGLQVMSWEVTPEK
ncbi:hypothetical protein [Lysobacter solisilvae (ex Woo and Kim 2020)]|uniref:Lipoprotein n=1 Tax=Agrilutibacter terrestris TaxID=2865112 RepID=A0A7H0FU98_9GAMM|nr:hypothetical protein [Lysobacter terrestris]QNP39614.1 hypothetical protein H8B22_08725 [Lysobacter terrestris]